MANQRNWMSTLAFKRFRSKHYELSKIYWTHQLGIDCIKNQLQYARPEKFITEILPASFKKGKFPMKHDEMLKWTDDYLARARLHLLVVCAANLESYLKSATNLFILGKGYSKYVKTKEGERLKINKVGEAIGAPILKRDSLPEPLIYAEKLFEISYEQHLEIWKKAYKLRSSMAHEGGVASERTLNDIPDIQVDLHKPFGLTWSKLREALASADEIVSLTDMKITSNKNIYAIEAELELEQLKRKEALPPKKDAWQFLHKKFSIQKISNKDKDRIIARIYSFRKKL